ncbi:MAG: adenylyl cyclase [Chloroflexi bacterium]|nr:adenylyl cyclase [Chloroflexota bacterium]OJV92792.1 MAG: adenylyl cyclase [Chloroflexi bacterium 54-19]
MLHLKSTRIGLVVILLGMLVMNAGATIASAAPLPPTSQPNFGSNVLIFDPSMPTSQIQAAVDAVAAQQVPNQFGTARYALLFKPGTYGTADAPLNFQVGYYTEVAGLGLSPNDVVINGSIYVRNQCDNGNCIALNNFWRSLSNLTINVTTPDFGCYSGEFWAVSQAAPMRRVNVTNGNVTLMDYCSGPSYASGGFIADSKAGTIINGSQQQFMVRNSIVSNWTNGVWNQVFSGVVGAPAECFPADASCGGNPYTTLANSPVTREKPFLYIDSSKKYNVFVPAPQTNSVGTTWENGPTPGKSIPLSDFFIARPGNSAQEINLALDFGRNILFTPGVYHLKDTLRVKRPDTVVLGLGFATLVPDRGAVTMSVASVKGVKLAGLLFDAGPYNSPVLLQVGNNGNDNHGYNAGNDDNNHNGFFDNKKSDPADPTLIADVFFRIGGATLGKATTSLVINSDNVIMDDIWAWRADHGNGVGWNSNTADTGLIVNGDSVTAYGLFVEHYQKYETLWNGNKGTVIFFQNEMPYDVPNQAAWMESRNVKGFPAFKVANNVKKFNGYGMGSYSFFNQHMNIFADHAFEAPQTLPAGSFHDLLTIFLDATNGDGGILHVINDAGGSSTIANPDVPVTVVNYP